MAEFVITNSTGSDIHVTELYTDVPANDSITIDDRSVTELASMRNLQKEIAAGNLSLAVNPTSDELASGLLSPPQSISGDDVQPVAATDVLAAHTHIRQSFAAGGGGSPDDITVYAVDNLPFKFRVIDAIAYVSATGGAHTLEVRDEAGGAGNLLATLDAGTTGRSVNSETATTVVTPAASKGLFVRRSDDSVGGEVLLFIRRES